jgi:hypothetical protein
MAVVIVFNIQGVKNTGIIDKLSDRFEDRRDQESYSSAYDFFRFASRTPGKLHLISFSI